MEWMTSVLEYCLSKPKSYEDHPFGEYPVCIKVHGKIFAQLYPNMITLKCTRFQGELFRQNYPGIVVRGYHCHRYSSPIGIPLTLPACHRRNCCTWLI